MSDEEESSFFRPPIKVSSEFEAKKPEDSADDPDKFDPFKPSAAENYSKTTVRLKSVAGASFVLLIVYAMILNPFRHSKPRPPVQTSVAEVSLEDRDPHSARNQQGFFKRWLCKGYQRSSFFCS